MQPSASSVALNRVGGGQGSQILGTLQANGQVYLVNPAGILFGKTAQVDVGGLVASTLAMRDDDFLAGRDRFGGAGAGSVVNEGRITVRPAAAPCCSGARCSNTGQISAPGGNVALAAGEQATLSVGANGHLQIAVDAAQVSTLVANGGLIEADGGQVILTAKGADALAASVVSNTGTIQARTVANQQGRILLLGDMEHGTVQVAGTLDASAPAGGNGGFIETSAAHVQVADGARVTTQAPAGQAGNWLIDPIDFTIGAGGAGLTTSGIGASTLRPASSAATCTIATSNPAGGSEPGDIHVNAPVSWGANTLTLNAHRNININAVMTARRHGRPGAQLRRHQRTAPRPHRRPAAHQDGALGQRLHRPGGLHRHAPTAEHQRPELHHHHDARCGRAAPPAQTCKGCTAVRGRYALGADIDAGDTQTWNAGAGFAPIASFSGDLRRAGAHRQRSLHQPPGAETPSACSANCTMTA